MEKKIYPREIKSVEEIPQHWNQILWGGTPTDPDEKITRLELIQLYDREGSRLYQLSPNQGVLIYEGCGHMHAFCCR